MLDSSPVALKVEAEESVERKVQEEGNRAEVLKSREVKFGEERKEFKGQGEQKNVRKRIIR